ncbi:hypothetical protein [Aliikangiella maris]|uniref:HDOD domain-containing protein n=2 Tax=Aliikangiella maris TaxID=3162458 RepID=A0ABV2BSJ2_9GAMM
MRLNPDQFTRWEPFVELKQQLHQIANQQLNLAPQARDTLETAVFNFIFTQNFDAIEGGYYIQQDDSLVCDSYQNLLIAEFFLLADRVFFNGQFLFIAHKIINNILTHQFDHERMQCHTQSCYPLNQIPFQFTPDELLTILSDEESRLLFSLLDLNLDQAKAQSTHPILICYKKDLKTAANAITMQIKQAQILENLLATRLSQQQISLYQLNKIECKMASHSKDSLSLIASTQLLSALTQLILWHSNQQYILLAEQLSKTLLEHIKQQETQSNQSLAIFIIYTLLTYQQINFNLPQLEQIASVFSALISNHPTVLSSASKQPTLQQQISQIIQILDYFNLRVSSEKKQLQQLNFTDNTLNIECISQSPQDLIQQQNYLAKYNQHLRLFIQQTI